MWKDWKSERTACVPPFLPVFPEKGKIVNLLFNDYANCTISVDCRYRQFCLSILSIAAQNIKRNTFQRGRAPKRATR